MTPEKQNHWDVVLQALRERNQQLYNNLLACLVLRNGEMEPCENGCCAIPSMKITIEEIANMNDNYDIAVLPDGEGVLRIAIVDQRHKRERHRG